MLDNKGNILQSPSPLKFFKKVGRYLFGDNRAKNQGIEDMEASKLALDDTLTLLTLTRD